jgi:hypothetical protein
MKWLMFVIFLSFIPEVNAQRIKYRSVSNSDSVKALYNHLAKIRGSKLKVSKDKHRLDALLAYATSDTLMFKFEHGHGNFAEVCSKSEYESNIKKAWIDSPPHKKIIKDKRYKSHIAVMVEWEMYGRNFYGYVARYYVD